MTISEMHDSFKLELDKTSSLEIPAFEKEEIDYWLNASIRKFVKTRYSGVNVKQEAFEQSQKRIDDLRTLVNYQTLSLYNDAGATCSRSTLRDNTYIADLTDLTQRYWFTLSEEVKIGFSSITDTTTVVTSGNLVVDSVYKVITSAVTHGGVVYQVGDYIIATGTTYTGGSLILASSSVEPVKEVTANTLPMELQNPYSEYRLHYEKASPLRLFLGNTVELITDGNYQPLLYNIRYLKQPRRVNYAFTTAYVTAGANVKDGITYLVSSNTVTYNGVQYAVAASFVGVTGVTGFTGTGTATEQLASCDLPEHTHDEVVRLAVNMALENVEQPRYQTHINEVVTME